MKDKEWSFTRPDLPFLFSPEVRDALIMTPPPAVTLDIRSLLILPINTVRTEITGENLVEFMANHGDSR